jgi:hypothetical protein
LLSLSACSAPYTLGKMAFEVQQHERSHRLFMYALRSSVRA